MNVKELKSKVRELRNEAASLETLFNKFLSFKISFIRSLFLNSSSSHVKPFTLLYYHL